MTDQLKAAPMIVETQRVSQFRSFGAPTSVAGGFQDPFLIILVDIETHFHDFGGAGNRLEI